MAALHVLLVAAAFSAAVEGTKEVLVEPDPPRGDLVLTHYPLLKTVIVAHTDGRPTVAVRYLGLAVPLRRMVPKP